jgi:hypothetical protein
MTRAFFPLRSSVELFSNPTGPRPVARAKQAAVLYDEVFFEDGLINAELTKEGSILEHVHPDGITDEVLERSRRVPDVGTGFELTVGFEEGPDQPATPAPHFTIRGQYTAKYTAQWRTGVLDELAGFKPDWARYKFLPDDDLKENGLLDVAGQIAAELEADELAPDDPTHRSFIVGSFSRDLAVAGSLGATVQVTSLFEPLLRSKLKTVTAHHETSGADALGIAVPGVSALPWEAIEEFREHHGSKAAREKLREIEQRIQTEELGDAAEFVQRVGAEVTSELFAVIRDLQGSLGLDLARHAASTALSVIPFASEIAAIGETALATRRRRHAWHAALMKLNPGNGAS